MIYVSFLERFVQGYPLGLNSCFWRYFPSILEVIHKSSEKFREVEGGGGVVGYGVPFGN